MALNQNQFLQTPVQGEMDMQFPGNTTSMAVDSTQAVALVAGQFVKVVNSLGGVPKVVACVDSDTPAGCVSRNPKDATFAALSRLEVAGRNAALYMTANGAIARFAPVQAVNATVKVAPWDGSSPIVGYAFDAASVDGDLIRVVLDVPQAGTAAERVIYVEATLAEINAGKVLIPGVLGKSITVTNFIERVTGAFITTTSVDLVSDATSVNVESTAVAGLTNGAVLTPNTANVTLGAGFGIALPAAEGLKVQKTGAAAAGGTKIGYTISYKLA